MISETSQQPEPQPMPVDHKQWLAELHLCNFANAYYQYRDLTALGGVRSVLMVGPGQGLETAVLRWRDFLVTTFDIDDRFRPDVIGSVHDLGVFGTKSFDAVVVSHVLEHLPVPYLDPSLQEIARIGRFALIYLPVHGRHIQARFIPGFGGLDFSLFIDIFNYFERPTGLQPKYMAGQHYWEVGMRGFRVKDLCRRISRFFDVVQSYRNPDWLPSHNFVLRAKESV